MVVSAEPAEAPQSATAAVDVIGVSKSFEGPSGTVHALRNVSLTIAQNEFFTLLGPSGCGKTTLLRLIAGFETPGDGEIRLDGEAIGDRPPYRRMVNTVFQSYALFPHMTVGQNVAFGLELKGMGKEAISRRLNELLSFLAGQQTFLIAGSVSFLLIVIIMTWWLRQSVILRLQGMQNDLVAMEKNADLTQVPVLKGRDEVAGVANALGGLVSRFEHFIADIRMAAGGLDERSGALDNGAESLQAASEQTRKQINDVSQSMAAIADQASAIERATDESANTVISALAANEEVQSRLTTSEQAAEHTVDVISRVSGSIHALNESTGKIEQVIGVIADIAEQTNLLALNAAIEAARAGEHGCGFAVVADEVRTLSRRTSDSTRNISQWVQDLVSGVSSVDVLLEEMRDAGSSNREHLAALKGHLQSLQGQFVDLENHSTEISSAVAMQRDEIGRVGRRSTVLDESADFLIESVEQTRTISEALRHESASMRQLIARFRTAEEPA